MAKDNSTGKTKGFYERGQAIFDRIPGMPEDDAPAPSRLYDLREWLMSQIDGSEETRGDDGLISHFINQIDALYSLRVTIPDAERKKVMDAHLAATVEPKGCPTPGSCSAVAERKEVMTARALAESIVERATVYTPKTDAATVRMERLDGDIDEVVSADFARTLERELIDLKQRLLPQFAGRAQRAEHERDGMLEQLIEARSAIQQAYGCLWRYTGSSNPMFLQARKMLLARLTKEQQASGIRYANELFGHTTEHEILHSDCSHDAAPSATAAPVAWCVAYDDPRMGRIHSDATMNKLQAEELAARRGLALVPLYAAPQAAQVEAGATDRPDWAQQLPGAEIFDRSNDAGGKP